MRKIRVFQHMSLDGVIQSPGSQDEDRDDGFVHGGWLAPFSEPAVRETIAETHGDPFDLLLGRRTYDIWSGYWPNAEGNPFAKGFNAARKYVATHRADSLAWQPAESLGQDVVEGTRRMKEAAGPDIIVWGSSTLIPLLLAHGLADAVTLFVYPVLLGAGKRLFSGDVAPRELVLDSSRALPSGILLNSYRPCGALRTGTFGDAAATGKT